MATPRDLLKQHFSSLITDGRRVLDKLEPNTVSKDQLGKEIKGLQIKSIAYSIAISVMLIALNSVFLSYPAFDTYQNYFYVASLIGIFLTWSLFSRLTSKKVESKIKNHDKEKNEWMSSLKYENEYQNFINESLNSCYRFSGLYNYFALKSFLVDKNPLSKEVNFITRKGILDGISQVERLYSYHEGIMATLKIIRFKALKDSDLSWLDNNYSAPNLVADNSSEEIILKLEELTSLIVRTLYETSSNYYKEKESSSDLENNVFSLIKYKEVSKNRYSSKYEKGYVGTVIVFQKLATIIEPYFEKSRITLANNEGINKEHKTESKNVMTSLNELKHEVLKIKESTHQARTTGFKDF